MNKAITFDTLQYAKKLREAGVKEREAEVHAEALAEILDEQIATKQDILMVKQDILRIELKIAESKSEIIKWVFGIVAGQAVLLMSFIHSIA